VFGFSSEFKVGVITLVAVGIFAYFVMHSRDAPFGLGDGYSVFVNVPSAEGLTFGSAVQMAGVKVGRVGKIGLAGKGIARIELQLDGLVDVPADTQATVKTMGVLGDRTVHLLPGEADTKITPGADMGYLDSPGDIERVAAQVSKLAENFDEVAQDIKKITDDIKVVTGKLRGTLIDGELIESIKSTLENAQKFSATLTRLGVSSEEDYGKIVENIRAMSATLREMADNSKQLIEGSGTEISKQLSGLQEATVRLNAVLASVNSLVEGVGRGEGTVGKLFTDSTTVDELNDAIAQINDVMDSVGRFQTTVNYRGDFYAIGDPLVAYSMKNTLGLTLASRPDYYYLIELVSDPVPDSSLRGLGTDVDYSEAAGYRLFSDAYQISFQFARRYRDLILRLGLKENHGGVGADYLWNEDKVAVSLDLYDFSTRDMPNLELRARYGFYNHLYLSAGLDDVLNRGAQGSVNLYVGGGFSFQDDDLKYLLTFLPTP